RMDRRWKKLYRGDYMARTPPFVNRALSAGAHSAHVVKPFCYGKYFTHPPLLMNDS
ncbi:MAG: hypothetical protein JWR09_361, partial [Mucilaginibacter sp.]|nr:hypothetical protein [Mucilaginibacter sp.]